MDKRYLSFFCALLFLISCTGSKTHQDTQKYNSAYDIGAIPHLNDFLKYNIHERMMDSVLSSSGHHIEKYGYLVDSGLPLKAIDTGPF